MNYWIPVSEYVNPEAEIFFRGMERVNRWFLLFSGYYIFNFVLILISLWACNIFDVFIWYIKKFCLPILLGFW